MNTIKLFQELKRDKKVLQLALEYKKNKKLNKNKLNKIMLNLFLKDSEISGKENHLMFYLALKIDGESIKKALLKKLNKIKDSEYIEFYNLMLNNVD